MTVRPWIVPGVRPGVDVSARARWGLLVAWAVVVCGCHMTSPAPVAERAAEPPVAASATGSAPLLRVEGRHFVDPDGRVVLLRGVNLAGDSKVPPFLPLDDPAALDPLPALGINAVRLLFLWEAYEPEPGEYDEAYLGRMVAIARAAWRRNLYVIVDFHQDGLSRWASRGCGAGFPAWALSPRARRAEPDNGCGCKGWVFHLVTDRDVHRSFADFYADVQGVRTRYLAMIGRVASAFADCPGVVGYDPLNEPWGNELEELAPLQRDAAAALRSRHPGAILFIAGHGTTSCGIQTRLPRPGFGNFAYSPHYYLPHAVAMGAWDGVTRPLDHAFATMQAKADAWGVPLFVGEFGIGAEVRRSGDYVAALYDRLDQALASGAQWNYTPRWNEHARDGWNAEDYSILDHRSRARRNFQARPYAQKVAGVPRELKFQSAGLARGEPPRFECSWQHDPTRGATELYVPLALFPSGSSLTLDPPDTTCTRDDARQLLVIVIRASRATSVRVTLSAP
ncbi:MAG: cellulase family glycosylhydrolase [Isosphaeraceae bacterium]|nr:cellulase family glycosylhydrolase [Isosphaeraceae bacterium]